jgi:hypothetical protein
MTDQELNEAVARKLGWVKLVIPHDAKHHTDFRWLGPDKKTHETFPLPYSTDIAAAWEIVEWFQKSPDRRGWPVLNLDDTGWIFQTVDSAIGVYAEANTAPRAICKAFLGLDTAKP